MTWRPLLGASLCFTVLTMPPLVGSEREADAYRLFARSSEGQALLEEARGAMNDHWNPAPRKRVGKPIPWPAGPRGVYLSLTEGSTTRACVGNVAPYRGDLVATVRALAVQSLQADRRHTPIRSDELPNLRIVISFAGAVEPITDPMQVNPGRDGLLITSTGGSVAFLPGEARTVAWALREARRIGIIQGSSESARYSRFPVVVLSEPQPQRSSAEEDSHETR